MLKLLRINNIALIPALDLELGPGLTLLTGETGAGKSILIDALGLVLGDRASPDLIRSGEERATVEAVFESAGAQGLLSVTPYYNKPTPDGLVRHYQAIAEATPLPIVVYNVPGRTGCNVDPATLARLASIPHVAGVKEASGNMAQIAEALVAVPPEFLVLCGDDALTLPSMAIGAKGIVSVASNELPAEMAQLVEAAEAGDFTFAREIHARLLPLMLANFAESNPIPVKAVMAQMELLEEHYRLPMVAPRPETREKLARVLARLKPAAAPVHA